MAERVLVTVGASAGGIEAFTRLARGLPADFPAPIVVVVHVSTHSVLPLVIGRACPLPTSHARDGERPLPGHVYIAPPGTHLVIDDGRLRLRHGPRENGVRPAIDQLFRSAAREAHARVIGVILSGHLDDGVAGLYAIKARGGIAVVQDPKDAAASSMPRSALRYVDADYCLPADKIGPILAQLADGGLMSTRKKRAKKGTNDKRRAGNSATASGMRGRDQKKIGDRHRGTPPASPEQDPLRCPDCSGPLYRVTNGDLVQWACREGHAFSPDSLNDAQTEALERALWLSVRTLKERALVDRTMSERIPDRSQASRERLGERAQATEKDVELLREILARL